MHPSDARLKTSIEPLDNSQQLHNLRQLSLYRYLFVEPWTQSTAHTPRRLQGEAGVLAQELCTILPEAVENTGDVVLGDGTHIERLLVVNRDRLYLENIGATQELARISVCAFKTCRCIVVVEKLP